MGGTTKHTTDNYFKTWMKGMIRETSFRGEPAKIVLRLEKNVLSQDAIVLQAAFQVAVWTDCRFHTYDEQASISFTIPDLR